MKKLFFMIAIMMLVSGALAMTATPSYAEEPAIGSAADNACNPGGSLEGKCTTEWHWGCGYYLARWEAAGGWGGDYPMPTFCAGVLPPLPPVVITIDAGDAIGGDVASLAGCYENTNPVLVDVYYNGIPDTISNLQLFNNGATPCGGTPAATPNRDGVSATSQPTADAACTTLNGNNSVGGVDMDGQGWTGLVDLWLCAP